METDNKLCFMGEKPVLKNSVIENMGENNILFCEKNVVLVNSKIDFRGSDSLIYLSSSRCEYKLNIAIHNQQVCFWGRDNYINGIVNVILSEQKHIFIGSDNLFSLGIWMRNADPYLIYDSEMKERVNSTQSIYIGDHVWIGQSVMILKGSKIGSGSIVGAMSLVSGSTIPSNECWGGVPARCLKKGVFWDRECVHGWTEETTNERKKCENDTYIFKQSVNHTIDFEEIDVKLSNKQASLEKLNYLLKLIQTDEKNRFAIM